MKIVINECYRGFGVSVFGEIEYLKRKGKECYYYQNKNDDLKSKEYVRVDNIDFNNKRLEWSTYATTKDYGKTATYNQIFEGGNYFYSRDIERDDLDLIYLVEKYGDKMSGECGKLKVVEIPDDIEWEINEYDGMESVEEKHNSWS